MAIFSEKSCNFIDEYASADLRWTYNVPSYSYCAAMYWQDLKLVDDLDETNGVMQIESESHESTLYSVSGVKVTNLRKGQVLIKKGKKVVY